MIYEEPKTNTDAHVEQLEHLSHVGKKNWTSDTYPYKFLKTDQASFVINKEECIFEMWSLILLIILNPSIKVLIN